MYVAPRLGLKLNNVAPMPRRPNTYLTPSISNLKT
jgi:hypothetical protein